MDFYFTLLRTRSSLSFYPRKVLSRKAEVDIPEESTDLVATLVDLLTVEGEANTEGEAWVDLCVVGEGDHTAVVNLGLDKGTTG